MLKYFIQTGLQRRRAVIEFWRCSYTGVGHFFSWQHHSYTRYAKYMPGIYDVLLIPGMHGMPPLHHSVWKFRDGLRINMNIPTVLAFSDRVLPLCWHHSTCSGPNSYEVGQPKSGQSFLESKLVNHCKLGLQIWKHWPWLNSANAGPNSLRIRLEFAEMSKKTQNYHFLATFFGLQICMTAPKIVFPDQGGIWRRQSWRHY